MEISNKIKPPTHRALMATLQFMADSYPTSFKTLLEESGEQYDTTVLPHGNTLLAAMDTYQDILDSEATYEERTERKRIDALLKATTQSESSNSSDPAGPNEPKPVSVLQSSHDYIHQSNIITLDLAYDPQSSIVATGSTDKTVKVTDYAQQQILYSSASLPSPVLSVAFNPVVSDILAVTCMNGYSCLIDYKQESVVQEFKDHKKYIVQVKWSNDGRLFATASHDSTVRLYKCADGTDESASGSWSCVHVLEYKEQVEAIEFVPGSNLLIVSVRNDCYLRVVDTTTGKECGNFNMNSSGDDHVSFAALDITCNSDGAWTLVTTDKHRVIMFETGTSLQVRNFYGAINDHLSNPKSVWGSGDQYVYCTSQDMSIVGWDVYNDKQIPPLQGHTRVVRDLCSRNGVLASGSFDRTVKIWSPNI